LSIKGLVGLTGANLTFTHGTTFLSAVDGLISSGQADRINVGFDAVPFGPAIGLFSGRAPLYLRNDE